MPYGTMDATTERYLTDAGIDISTLEPSEDAGVGISISIIFEGALDESFDIDADADYSRVVDAIADRMADEWDWLDKQWTVDAYRVYLPTSDDECYESDGSPPLYVREGADGGRRGRRR